ncbi:MAG: cation-translocating P-type ATPase, partial [Candidatus Ranarchaeia archaeon]
MSKVETYNLTSEESLELLDSSTGGITEDEASQRLLKYGENSLIEYKKITPFQIFVNQFKDLMVIILIFAALISALLGEEIDAIVIGSIVILNAVLGFIQEYRAEEALEALKEYSAPTAFVVRNGKGNRIPSKFIVPGDIVELEAGDKVPVDGRLLESINLKIDEAILTGESHDVSKIIDPIEEKSSLGDLKNTVFMGTLVTYGRGRHVATNTGMNTEMGTISEMVATAPTEQTPLEKQLHKLSKALFAIILMVCAAIFVLEIVLKLVQLEILTAPDIVDIFLVAVSLAVSAIPEGLPAVVTTSLALGTQRMAKRKAIVRRLASVQTLGSTTVIVSDKTGTITKNEMTIREIATLNHQIMVSGTGYEPKGEFSEGKVIIDPNEHPEVRYTILTGLLCNTSTLYQEEDQWAIQGDPTEGAMVVLAEKAKMAQEKEMLKFNFENPFDSTRKMMSVIYRHPDGRREAFVKGAPELVLTRCNYILDKGEKRPINDHDRNHFLLRVQEMADSALRTLLCAVRDVEEKEELTPENIENNLMVLGVVGMIDPPRDGVKESIRICNQAGIKVVINTGDHKRTAIAISKEIGLFDPREDVLTGKDLDEMNDDELDCVINHVSTFARGSPIHKVRVLQSLKRHGHLVAMTGDGVNDAPALKNADIGIAMGIKGTDVAKEASDMILLDDNFNTIVNAVEEGRGIFDNIKKFIRYLLSSNFDEILVVAVAALLFLPIPYLAVQILWINLVTDGFPALALTMDPKNPDIMERPPETPGGGFLRNVIFFSLVAGVISFIATFSLFLFDLNITGPQMVLLDPTLLILNPNFIEDRARTIAFTTSVVFEMILVFTIRSNTKSMFSKRSFNNKYLLIAVTITFVLQLFVIYVPFFHLLLSTVTLNLVDWIVMFLLCFT